MTLRRLNLAAVAIALLVLVLGSLFSSREVAAACLVALVSMACFPLGCLTLAMLLALVSGSWCDMLWSGTVRIARTTPLIGVMSIPVIIGMSRLCPWADSSFSGFRGFWLSPAGFAVRTFLYAAVWSALALWALPRVRLRPGLAAAGALLMVLTLSAAGIDWIMTLDERFYSSIFGLLYFARVMLSAIAVAILIALSRHAQRPGVLRGVLVAALQVWLYLHFMQYLLIWSADLPRETHWYLVRVEGLWRGVLWAIAVGQGVLVFLVLLFAVSERPLVLSGLCWITIASGLLECAWLVTPSLEGLRPVAVISFTLVAWLGYAALLGQILVRKESCLEH
ncbi:hypothetical protein NHG95_18910 [Pseudomonas corrugata]|uniref:hypothetical protein n=1 Tax=Pseudomonas corrugata TaxID=47879 RepID=UPI0028C3E8D4|nr:hypothetical protein [Pseudomonas corrugata]MDU9035221.1 hypothetical protein [Pseudomonas corrugata]